MKILGILGGIGPEATGAFYSELIAYFQKEIQPKNNTEYPRIIINSIPAPELTDGEVTAETIAYYRQGLKDLETWGAELIVIVCNTAYCFLGTLREGLKIPILNSSHEVQKHLLDSSIRKVLILGSPRTMTSGLYEFPTIEYFPLEQEKQEIIGQIIGRYNIGIVADQDLHFIEKIGSKATASGYRVVAACTEIKEILMTTAIPFIDPMDLLIKVLVSRWNYESSLKLVDSSINGKGIKTSAAIPNNTEFYWVSVHDVSDQPVSHWAHINGVWFADPTILNWVNHSCESNTEIILIEGQPVLRSTRDIRLDEEITCDYNRTEIDGERVPCECKSRSCRGYFLRK